MEGRHHFLFQGLKLSLLQHVTKIRHLSWGAQERLLLKQQHQKGASPLNSLPQPPGSFRVYKYSEFRKEQEQAQATTGLALLSPVGSVDGRRFAWCAGGQPASQEP